MTTMTKLENKIGTIKMNRERSKATCDKFAEDFVKSPQYAMEWSSDAFTAAAEIQVVDIVLAVIFGHENEETDEEIITEVGRRCEQEVMFAARYIESSTSTSSNLAKRKLLAAWANMSETFNGRY